MALELGHEWIDWERERVRSFALEARRWVAPLLLGSALAGLFLVALRGNLLQMRYQLDASLSSETELTKEKAQVTAGYWEMRSATKLGRHAEVGFEIPTCVISVRPDGSRPATGCGR
ncbi:MAG: hypothetical protein JRH10_02725 [Deltaproteobacteria bacterium]|nr:hypothetical protein [Deltaproteobacteria bacterium]MBW2445702.1 hypothetical protein [Deltaproteobacteria bacterium]